jgi:NADH dehydrogenase
MKNIIIVGGGFAGVWAALGAARQVAEHEASVKITVVSKDPHLNVRPRLYEKNPDALRTPLAPTLDPIDVEFVEATVTSTNIAAQTVELVETEGRTRRMPYDRLILATGSELRELPVPGLAGHGWNIDTFDAAINFDRHLKTVLQSPEGPGHNTFVIIGAGFTGIELATEMRDRIAEHGGVTIAESARIVLVEKADAVGPDLGSNPRPAVEAALQQAGIELKLGTSVDAVSSNSVTLSNGETIDAKTVVSAAGMEAKALPRPPPADRDELGRIVTDESLRAVGLHNVFVAGDAARAFVDDEHVALMSCQHAMEMGKFAGHNAVNDLLDLPLRRYHQPVYLTCIDLGRSGALFTSGWDRQIQMSGDDAKNMKRQINTQWIYPPVGTREQILSAVGTPGARD